ncbi:MAG: V-type ATP synthase subunit A, partial [Oscillospiraceae bacterium]|nr:V-type ATP synthase subunit A [Oscillospiraceae bacterium]
GFMECRRRIVNLLHEENKLMEIVKLIGSDVLPDDQKLVIEVARVIRVGFLQQNAYHKDDTYVPLEKQYLMMKSIINLCDTAMKAVAAGVPISRLASAGLFERVIKVKYDIPNDKPEMFEALDAEVSSVVDALIKSNR